MVINITVTDLRPVVVGWDGVEPIPTIICGNSGYKIQFVFDSAWAGLALKTARFVYVQNGAVGYKEVPFNGNTVNVPILTDIREVYVGVYAGDLRTTTPARILCERSIICVADMEHEDPDPDVYAQIMAVCNQIAGKSAALLEYGLGEMGMGNNKICCATDEELKLKINNGFWAYRNENENLIDGISSKFVKGITLAYSNGAVTQIGVCNSNGIIIIRELFNSDWTAWRRFIDAIGAVPTTRKINGLPLSADIDLTAEKVGAAPFGFGLGLMGFTDGVTTGIECATPAEVDGRTANGFWVYKSDTPLLTSDTTGVYSKHVTGITFAYGSGVATQIGFCNYKQPRWIVRSKYTNWSDWEWVNPPMIASVEYRTTERCGDLPVYAKRISYTPGVEKGSTTSTVSVYVPHGVTNFGRCVRCIGMRSTLMLPMIDATTGGSSTIRNFNSDHIVLQIDKMVVPANATFTFDFYYTKTE
jgi:hypothetical protein